MKPLTSIDLVQLQNALRDLNDRIRVLESKSSGTKETDLTEVYSEINRIKNIKNQLDYRDVFRGSGAAHSFGYVPDPGATAGNGKYLCEDGSWQSLFVKYGDITIPSGSMILLGGASDPTRSSSTNLLVFSSTADNLVSGMIQMPPNWKEGTAIIPHIHIRFTTLGTTNTRWKMEYDVGTPGSNFANNSTVYTNLTTITVQNPNNVKSHAWGSFGDLPMTGHTLGAMVLWKITRLAASDAADDETGTIGVLGLGFRYQIDAIGSTTATSK